MFKISIKLNCKSAAHNVSYLKDLIVTVDLLQLKQADRMLREMTFPDLYLHGQDDYSHYICP